MLYALVGICMNCASGQCSVHHAIHQGEFITANRTIIELEFHCNSLPNH